jgi:hypothetical protein
MRRQQQAPRRSPPTPLSTSVVGEGFSEVHCLLESMEKDASRAYCAQQGADAMASYNDMFNVQLGELATVAWKERDEDRSDRQG